MEYSEWRFEIEENIDLDHHTIMLDKKKILRKEKKSESKDKKMFQVCSACTKSNIVSQISKNYFEIIFNFRNCNSVARK